MSKQKPHFHNDLKHGQATEALIAKLFSNLQQTDGKKGDLLAPDGSLIELKCDRYPMSKTENFFMEHFGNIDTGKLGGPYKAFADGCKYFMYYYNTEGIGFLWRTEDLLKQLEAMQLKPVEVRNVRWVTVGYKVPRATLNAGVTFNSKEILTMLPEFSDIIEQWGFKQK